MWQANETQAAAVSLAWHTTRVKQTKEKCKNISHLPRIQLNFT